MDGKDIYKVAVAQGGKLVKLICEKREITGNFSGDNNALYFSSISNIWDFAEARLKLKGGSVKGESILAIETGDS